MDAYDLCELTRPAVPDHNCFKIDQLIDADKVLAAGFHGPSKQREALVAAIARYLVATDINGWQRLKLFETETRRERELQVTSC